MNILASGGLPITRLCKVKYRAWFPYDRRDPTDHMETRLVVELKLLVNYFNTKKDHTSPPGNAIDQLRGEK